MKISGDLVRTLREGKSWSQEHLANAAGLSVRTVQRVESESIGSAETRLALAAALDMPVSALIPATTRATDSPTCSAKFPVGAWIGIGVGAFCSLGAIAYTYFSAAASIEDASRSAGIICALLGMSLGIMGCIQGWIRSRAATA